MSLSEIMYLQKSVIDGAKHTKHDIPDIAGWRRLYALRVKPIWEPSRFDSQRIDSGNGMEDEFAISDEHDTV